MKSAAELRLENLETLVKEAGTADALAEKCGLSAEYISQLRNRAIDKKTGRARNLGSQAARKLEVGMGKAIGWMDTNHASHTYKPSSQSDWPFSKVSLDRLLALSELQKNQVDDALDIILRGFEADRRQL